MSKNNRDIVHRLLHDLFFINSKYYELDLINISKCFILYNNYSIIESLRSRMEKELLQASKDGNLSKIGSIMKTGKTNINWKDI